MSDPKLRAAEEAAKDFAIAICATIVKVFWEHPDTHERYSIQVENEASMWTPGLHVTTTKVEI
jgi:hypothetical protein